MMYFITGVDWKYLSITHWYFFFYIFKDENIISLFNIKNYSDNILKYLKSDSTENDLNIHLVNLRLEILNLLHNLSGKEFGIKQILINFDINR